VKAFNPILRGVLADDRPLNVFFAGDDTEAKARVLNQLDGITPGTREPLA
jgi:predicted dinucleotide-binding enzyme